MCFMPDQGGCRCESLTYCYSFLFFWVVVGRDSYWTFVIGVMVGVFILDFCRRWLELGLSTSSMLFSSGLFHVTMLP